MNTYDSYQLWKVWLSLWWWRFGLKITVLSRATSLVSISDNINTLASATILCILLLMKSKANKLPLETKAELAYDNMILMLKPGYQTLITPHSTDNIIAVTIELLVLLLSTVRSVFKWLLLVFLNIPVGGTVSSW